MCQTKLSVFHFLHTVPELSLEVTIHELWVKHWMVTSCKHLRKFLPFLLANDNPDVNSYCCACSVPGSILSTRVCLYKHISCSEACETGTVVSNSSIGVQGHKVTWSAKETEARIEPKNSGPRIHTLNCHILFASRSFLFPTRLVSCWSFNPSLFWSLYHFDI